MWSVNAKGKLGNFSDPKDILIGVREPTDKLEIGIRAHDGQWENERENRQ